MTLPRFHYRTTTLVSALLVLALGKQAHSQSLAVTLPNDITVSLSLPPGATVELPAGTLVTPVTPSTTTFELPNPTDVALSIRTPVMVRSGTRVNLVDPTSGQLPQNTPVTLLKGTRVTLTITAAAGAVRAIPVNLQEDTDVTLRAPRANFTLRTAYLGTPPAAPAPTTAAAPTSPPSASIITLEWDNANERQRLLEQYDPEQWEIFGPETQPTFNADGTVVKTKGKTVLRPRTPKASKPPFAATACPHCGAAVGGSYYSRMHRLSVRNPFMSCRRSIQAVHL